MTNNERISANNEELRGILDTVQDLPDAGGGYDEGYEAGYGEGFNYGRDEGYETGYMEGRDEGMDEGYARGKQAEYDAFWDVCQENGNRTNYSFAFGGYGWRDSVYNPKYPIVATNTAYSTFYNTGITDTKVPIVIDTTGTVGSLFNWSSIQRIPSIKITEKVTNVDWFAGCSGLEVLNVTEDSVIAASGMNLTYCTKLTHDSLMSVINALKDYSGTGTSRTVTLGDANAAKLSDAEYLIAVNKGWTVVPARTIATDFVMCENCYTTVDDPDGTLYGSECPDCGGFMGRLACSECGAKAESAEDIFAACEECDAGNYVI